MPKRNLLLLAAVIGLAVFASMVIVISVGIQSFGSGWNADDAKARRQSVGDSLAAALPAEVDSADDADLALAVEQLKAEPYIAWVWVVDPQGVILSAYNGPAEPGDDVNDLSQYEEDLIFAVEPARMDPLTELELRLAMALRREGEHNDIYGHLVRAIPGPDGKTAALVGVTYESTDTSAGWLDIVFVLLGAAGFAAYWLGLPLWTALDARSGGSSRTAVLWGLFVLIANVAGLVAYLLIKHRSA